MGAEEKAVQVDPIERNKIDEIHSGISGGIKQLHSIVAQKLGSKAEVGLTTFGTDAKGYIVKFFGANGECIGSYRNPPGECTASCRW